jgi:hypothetical protein
MRFKPQQETVDFIAELIIKIIGESIIDRTARTIFILIVAIGSQMVPTANDQKECIPPVKAGMQKIQHNN